jgi:sulfoxide reductase heme-binding subunit YedZ
MDLLRDPYGALARRVDALSVRTSATPHLFWITSRAAGFSALILASLAVSLGLLMSTKLLKGRGPDLLVTHEILSLATIVAIVVHGTALLGDQFMHPSLADISIPFVSGYKTIWTSIGIVSGWTLILLGLSYYARRRIGAARWRKLHRFTAVAWLAGVLHSIGEGTDAGQLWFLAMLAIVAVPAIALLVRRWWWPGPSSRPGAASSAGRGSLQPRGVARDEAGGAGHRLRPARAPLGQRNRVEAPARDHHPRVAGVRVDGDPPARPGFAPALEACRVEG